MVIARPSEVYPDPSWSGWGDAEQMPVLTEAMLALLRDSLGVSADVRPAVALSEISLAPSRLPRSAVSELSAVVGSDHVLC